MNKQDRLLENLAAISGNLHSSSTYEHFYETHGPRLGGFTGIWQFCIVAAQVFTDVEGRLFWDGEYIDAIDAYTALLLDAETLPDLYTKRDYARQAIREALEKNSTRIPARLK